MRVAPVVRGVWCLGFCEREPPVRPHVDRRPGVIGSPRPAYLPPNPPCTWPGPEGNRHAPVPAGGTRARSHAASPAVGDPPSVRRRGHCRRRAHLDLGARPRLAAGARPRVLGSRAAASASAPRAPAVAGLGADDSRSGAGSHGDPTIGRTDPRRTDRPVGGAAAAAAAGNPTLPRGEAGNVPSCLALTRLSRTARWRRWRLPCPFST
jgi:hypothetical protein